MPVLNKNAHLGDLCADISKNEEYSLAVMNEETSEELTAKQELYRLLEDGLNDIKNGNILSEKEMDDSIDLM